MSVRISSQAESARDQLLAELLEELIGAARQGQAADVEAVANRHPELADELRQLWATVRFAQQFSPQRSTLPPTLPYQPPAPAARAALPRTFGDYDLLEKLGQGGMGIVYKAWQRSLKRTVALKMILRGELATPGDHARFRVEGEATAHLEHPNIVAVYEAGECEGQPYFSMRYVEGQTLAGLLTNGPLRPREAARLLGAISRAVDHAHRKDILHRDLKPSNVLIDANGQPHVTDFGLAKRVARPEEVDAARGTVLPGAEGLTLSGAIVGTPTYMAPEQVSGSRGTPSPASDVYSLGVILYEMLTGRPPFQAPTPVDTLLLVLDQDPVRPGMLNPKVDPDLELICLKCLQKEPDLRYPSAAALAADLEAYQHGENLSVRSFGLLGLVALVNRALRETHHAVVLENWGLLWMWHSATILSMCILTNAMGELLKVKEPLWYLILWGGGLMVWGSIFWSLRKRGGPVLFVERQVAHVWGAAVLATISVFVIEILLGLPVLKLSPMLAVIAGMTFMVKAGMLSGSFYISAACLYLTAVPMAMFPTFGPTMFGVVSALCFFIPGLKYHRQRLRSIRAQQESEDNRSTVVQTPGA
jgi:eukaryotic-like serine/threonine-protein kinase